MNADGRGPAGFWSYSHDDDAADRGRILSLAADLVDEIRLQSGGDFVMFVDRVSLKWGDTWRLRIDESLSDTTFLLPIITPRYFTRPECVRELLEFHGQAKSLGLSALVLPILYVGVPDLSEESPDPAKAIVASLQWVDWRPLRLADPQSSEYRIGLSSLATRIMELSAEIGATQELRERSSSNAEPGSESTLTDLMARLNALLPELREAAESDEINYWKHVATDHVFQERLSRQKASKAPAGQVLATQIRLAEESLPYAERRLRYAQVYARDAVELDPTVLELARLADEHPDVDNQLEDLKSLVRYAVAQVKLAADRLAQDGTVESSEYFGSLGHVSRTFRKAAGLHGDANRLTAEANEIIQRWSVALGLEPIEGAPANLT